MARVNLLRRFVATVEHFPNNTKSARSKNGIQTVRVQQARSLVPPPASVNGRFTATQRYICSHNVFREYLIYPEDLGQFRGVARNSNSLDSNISAVRVRSVEVWQPYIETDPSLSVDQTCYLDWNVPNVANQFYDFDPTTQIVGSTASIAQPAYLRARPPEKSAGGRWCDLTNSSAHPAMFRLGVNNGAIIDVTFEFYVAAGGSGAYNSWPSVGYLVLTAGACYCACLDSFVGTRSLLPVGPTTVPQ